MAQPTAFMAEMGFLKIIHDTSTATATLRLPATLKVTAVVEWIT
uniref:Uncharacterized protein n=1 Tax=Arundo donax TaxID=35708 RepID=A0A0A9EUV0_ARUDO